MTYNFLNLKFYQGHMSMKNLPWDKILSSQKFLVQKVFSDPHFFSHPDPFLSLIFYNPKFWDLFFSLIWNHIEQKFFEHKSSWQKHFGPQMILNQKFVIDQKKNLNFNFFWHQYAKLSWTQNFIRQQKMLTQTLLLNFESD